MGNVKLLGFWAAVLSIFFGAAYSVPQILSACGLLPYPHDLFWMFLPSLFLAPSFVVAVICLHYSFAGTAKVYTAVAVAFATIYCAYAGMVYFTQLGVVLAAQFNGATGEKQVLVFPGRSFMAATDCLGYGFMSLSSLFTAFAFYNMQNHKWLFRSLLVNGLLTPVIILAFFFPAMAYAGAAWMITFPFAMINTARFFRGSSKINLDINLAL